MRETRSKNTQETRIANDGKTTPTSADRKGIRFPIAMAVVGAACLLAGVVLFLCAGKAGARDAKDAADRLTSESGANEKAADLREYNAMLASGQLWPAENGAAWFLADGVLLGYLELPSTGSLLAVRYGTAAADRGLGVLEGSSLPVGGESSHVCILGRTGTASEKLLAALRVMKAGDTFRIRCLGQAYAYEVLSVDEAESEPRTSPAIEQGSDMVTLMAQAAGGG